MVINNFEKALKANVLYHVTTMSNARLIAKQGLVPKIGPRSKNAGEHIPRIYMFPTYEDMVAGIDHWLGDQFDDDEELVFLRITLDKATMNVIQFDKITAYECTSLTPISHSCIEFFDEYSRPIEIKPADE